jgi:hypothetical protein
MGKQPQHTLGPLPREFNLKVSNIDHYYIGCVDVGHYSGRRPLVEKALRDDAIAADRLRSAIAHSPPCVVDATYSRHGSQTGVFYLLDAPEVGQSGMIHIWHDDMRTSGRENV